MSKHTQECLEYAAKTGRAFCIVQCADARRAREVRGAGEQEAEEVVRRIRSVMDHAALKDRHQLRLAIMNVLDSTEIGTLGR